MHRHHTQIVPQLAETPRARRPPLPPTPAAQAGYRATRDTLSALQLELENSAQNWRRAALAAVLMMTGSLALNYRQAAQPRLIPWMVEVDRVGTPRVIGPAGGPASDFVLPARCFRDHLRRFLEQLRSLSSDNNVNRLWLQRAWAMSSGTAHARINEFVDATTPIAHSATERVSVTVDSIIPVTPESWSVDWKEVRRGASGEDLGTTRWRGLFHLAVHPVSPDDPAKDAASLEANPFGIFVLDFDWKKLATD